MEKRRWFSALAAAAGIFVLIMDSRTALAGASQGLGLCLKTIIPSLFPFLFLSGTFSHACGRGGRAARWLGKPFGIPANMTSILVPALLGGYPVGAQCVYEAYRAGAVDKIHAQRMLAYCSNVGPAFLFGILPAAFPNRSTLWLLWGIQLLSVWAPSFVFSCSAAQFRTGETLPASFGMEQAVWAMLKICGWVILFRVLIAFLCRWILWAVSSQIQIAVIGLLELSNGCCMLSQIPAEGTRFLICSVMLSFGGLCVAYQTASVCPGLNLRGYLLGKTLQAVTSGILAAAVYFRLWPLLPLWLVALFGMRFAEKRSRNPLPVGV